MQAYLYHLFMTLTGGYYDSLHRILNIEAWKTLSSGYLVWGRYWDIFLELYSFSDKMFVLTEKFENNLPNRYEQIRWGWNKQDNKRLHITWASYKRFPCLFCVGMSMCIQIHTNTRTTFTIVAQRAKSLPRVPVVVVVVVFLWECWLRCWLLGFQNSFLLIIWRGNKWWVKQVDSYQTCESQMEFLGSGFGLFVESIWVVNQRMADLYERLTLFMSLCV